MNIVFVEGVINGLNKAKQTYKDTELFYKYDMLVFKESMKLSDLTGNLAPDKLLKEIHQLDLSTFFQLLMRFQFQIMKLKKFVKDY